MSKTDYKQIIIVTAIIKNKQGKFLLSKRHEPTSKLSHNKWQFIGGGIEFGEDPENAIVRECKEEAGIEVKVIRLLPKIFSHIWNVESKKSQILILSYECKIVSGTPTPSDDETGEVNFFSSKEIKTLDTLPQIKEAVKLFSK